MTKVLKLSDPYSKDLREFLLAHEGLNGDLGLPSAQYRSGDLQSVPVKPLYFGVQDLCWYNVLTASKLGLGKPAFGWAMWDGIYANSVAAQPHAVLEHHQTKKLACITPHDPALGSMSAITFFADARIPYDYFNDMAPPMLMKLTNPTPETERTYTWVDGDLRSIKSEYIDNFKMLKTLK